MNTLLQIIIAFASGGAVWEGFKFFYPDIKRPLTSRIEAKKTFYKNLDPILKSASELFGEIESLAKEDFSSFINLQTLILKTQNTTKNMSCTFFLSFGHSSNTLDSKANTLHYPR